MHLTFKHYEYIKTIACLVTNALLPALCTNSPSAGIVAGMTFLHKFKKVAHLDLKSHNILMDNNRPKIADFGLTAGTVGLLQKSAEAWTAEFANAEWRGERETAEPVVGLATNPVCSFCIF